MNISAMKRVRDRINREEDGVKLEMGEYFSDNGADPLGDSSVKLAWKLENNVSLCGSCACIAGHATIDKGIVDISRTWGEDECIHTTAEKYLRLIDEEAETLFMGIGAGIGLDEITRDQAVAMMNICIKNGDVKEEYWAEAVG